MSSSKREERHQRLIYLIYRILSQAPEGLNDRGVWLCLPKAEHFALADVTRVLDDEFKRGYVQKRWNPEALADLYLPAEGVAVPPAPMEPPGATSTPRGTQRTTAIKLATGVGVGGAILIWLFQHFISFQEIEAALNLWDRVQDTPTKVVDVSPPRPTEQAKAVEPPTTPQAAAPTAPAETTTPEPTTPEPATDETPRTESQAAPDPAPIEETSHQSTTRHHTDPPLAISSKSWNDKQQRAKSPALALPSDADPNKHAHHSTTHKSKPRSSHHR